MALAGPYASAFLVYPLPNVSIALFYLGWICWFFVFFISFGVLLARRWRAVAIFASAWVWLFFGPSDGPGETYFWFIRQGFRFHARPVEEYMSRCKLTDFVENGVKQSVGFCEGRDEGSFISSVFFDTTGELGLPRSRRTPEWNEAISPFIPKEVLADEGRARHLFGSFYRVDIRLEEFKG